MSSNVGVVPISVVVMTKNEEAGIARCLQALGSFAEVFVVDSHSSDRTVELATSLGAQVIQFDWNGEYPKKKQWALENCPFTQKWVMYVDADEIVPQAMVEELAALGLDDPQRNQSVGAFEAQLQYYFLGRPLRHGHRVSKRVLLRRSESRFPVVDDLTATNMWEVEGHYQADIIGRVERLRSGLIHHDRDPLYDYFARHNRYSDWAAHLSDRSRQDVAAHSSTRRTVFDSLPFQGLIFFIYGYILRGGWMDGRPGFHYAVAQSFYYWQISVKELELRCG